MFSPALIFTNTFSTPPSLGFPPLAPAVAPDRGAYFKDWGSEDPSAVFIVHISVATIIPSACFLVWKSD